MTPAKPLLMKAMICLDLDCEVRAVCPHAEPHPHEWECDYICGADEPCSKCSPVKEVTNE